MVSEATAHKKSGKRGGNKYSLKHFATFAASTLCLTIAAVLLIAEYNVLGIFFLLAGIAIAYFTTRFI